MSFTGEFSAKLNAKNQVTLPSTLREALFEMETSLPLTLFDRGDGEFLELFPKSEWLLIQQRTAHRARVKQRPELNRLLNRRAFPISLERHGDGRLVIPPACMRPLSGVSEIIFVGNTNKIEIWNGPHYRELYADGSPSESLFREELEHIIEY